MTLIGKQNLRLSKINQLNLMSDCDHPPPHHTGNQAHRHHASASEQHDTYDDNGEDVSAFAEAYPAEPPANDEFVVQRQEEQTNEVLPQNDAIPLVENSEPEDALPVGGENVQNDPAVPIVPLAPLPTTKPNKVHVELDTSVVAESEENDDANDQFVPLLPPKVHGKNNGRAPQVPPYSFFPNIFSDASGATIAVANAFSNGKGGARSHATAYGGSRGAHKRGAASKKRFADVE